MFTSINIRLLISGLVLMLISGCASFANLGAFGNSKSDANESSGQRYRVEMSNMMGRPTIFEGDLEENMTVQTALEKSGAIRRYRNMDIAVLRIVEGTGQSLRMVVQYLPAKRMVSSEQDYALLPNDRVIVEPASGFIDKFGGK